MKDYINPKRISDKKIRGIYPTQDNDYECHTILPEKVLYLSKRYRLSRAELRNLKISDIYLHSEECGSIDIEKENGQKYTRFVLGTEDISLLKSFIAEAEAEARELLLTPEEMIHDADLFHIRAMRARDMYAIVCQDIQEHPEHREFYKREIQTIFAAKGKPLKENLDIPYRCHGERRKKLIEMGKEPDFDRVAVLYVSCFVASHFRSSETIQRYLI